KHVELARASGALASLAMALNGRGMFTAWCGDFEATAAIVAECEAINEAMGIGARSMFSAGGLLLAAYQGRPDAQALLSARTSEFVERGLGHGAQYARWTTAILANGLGRYAEAQDAAQLAAYALEIPNGTGWALPELIEAAVRNRQPDVAR